MTGRSVFLVEDNADDEALVLRAFRKNNFGDDLTVARDGQEALDLLFSAASGGDPPCVVLLDLKLPKVDGIEVLRRVRADERTRLIPVIVLTSSHEEEDILTSYRLGANSYVRKPVDFMQFVEAVGQLGLYWLLLNLPPPPHPGAA